MGSDSERLTDDCLFPWLHHGERKSALEFSAESKGTGVSAATGEERPRLTTTPIVSF